MMIQTENETKYALESIQSKGGQYSYINSFSLGLKNLELTMEIKRSLEKCTRFGIDHLLTR